MKFFIKLGISGDTPEVPETPPTENAPLHRGTATEIEETHQYFYAGGKLLRETISDGTITKTLDFTYDNVGMPYSLIYNNGTTTTTYYYITNLQGDVMYLVDANGIQVAAYDYDPYSKIITATGDLAEINPLRYRGYYYDSETGFYYLQSRYYDPEICRFINGDKYSATATGFLGYNMFAYCNNNPIIVGAIVGGIASFASSVITDVLIEGKVDWGGAFISMGFGFVSGAAVAACPAFADLISAGMSAGESVLTDKLDGKSAQEIVINATISAGFGYILGSAGSSNAKQMNEAAKAIPKVLKGNHPLVKKAAGKVIKKALKTVLNSLAIDTVEGTAYSLLQKGTQECTKQIVKCYTLQLA